MAEESSSLAWGGAGAALAALHALVGFAASKHGLVFAPGCLVVRARSPEGRMALDAPTVAHLELLRNGRTGGEVGSLLHTLDTTLTSQGARLLRATLAFPLAHAPTLNVRLDAVEELAASPFAFPPMPPNSSSSGAHGGTAPVVVHTLAACAPTPLVAALSSLPDLDTLCTHFSARPRRASPKTSTEQVHAILALAAALSQGLPAIEAALGGAKSPLLALLARRCAQPGCGSGGGGGGGGDGVGGGQLSTLLAQVLGEDPPPPRERLLRAPPMKRFLQFALA